VACAEKAQVEELTARWKLNGRRTAQGRRRELAASLTVRREPQSCVGGGRKTDKPELPLRAVSLVRASNGMAALARTPVLPEATVLGVLSAQLRRPRTQSATQRPLDCQKTGQAERERDRWRHGGPW
jgi:hypothetical protein